MDKSTIAALIIPTLLLGIFLYRRFRTEYRKIRIRSENEALLLIYHAILNSDTPKFVVDPNSGNLEADIGQRGRIRLRRTTKVERMIHDLPVVVFIRVKSGNIWIATASIFTDGEMYGSRHIVRANLELGDPQPHRSDSIECTRDLSSKIASHISQMISGFI
jgi:hypothetical protein